MSAAVLPWHRQQWQRVEAAMAAERLAHGLLLCGPEGCGIRRFADRLAAGLLCTAAAPERPCGSCPACRQSAAGTHPDQVCLEPESAGKAIGVDGVRGLIERAQRTATQGRKVAIVDPADAMSANAANSLLKTLEEPPAGTHLLLISHRSGRLPATVRSRCQRVTFNVPPTATGAAWLAQQGVGDPERWLAAAGGGPLGALELSLARAGESDVDPAALLLAVLARERSPVGAAAALGDAALEPTVRTWIATVEDMLRVAHAAGDCIRLRGQGERLARTAARLDARELFDYLDQLKRALPGPSQSLRSEMQLQGLLIAAAELARGSNRGAV